MMKSFSGQGVVALLLFTALLNPAVAQAPAGGGAAAAPASSGGSNSSGGGASSTGVQPAAGTGGQPATSSGASNPGTYRAAEPAQPVQGAQSNASTTPPTTNFSNQGAVAPVTGPITQGPAAAPGRSNADGSVPTGPAPNSNAGNSTVPNSAAGGPGFAPPPSAGNAGSAPPGGDNGAASSGSGASQAGSPAAQSSGQPGAGASGAPSKEGASQSEKSTSGGHAWGKIVPIVLAVLLITIGFWQRKRLAAWLMAASDDHDAHEHGKSSTETRPLPQRKGAEPSAAGGDDEEGAAPAKHKSETAKNNAAVAHSETPSIQLTMPPQGGFVVLPVDLSGGSGQTPRVTVQPAPQDEPQRKESRG